MKSDSITTLRKTINRYYLADEKTIIQGLLEILKDYDSTAIGETARKLVTAIRQKKDQQPVAEAFLNEYQLNTHEGIILMGIAEALLRIPDAPTQDIFLQEKLTGADWRDHLEHSDSFLVNMSTRALLLSGKIEEHFLQPGKEWHHVFDELLSRLGIPVIRSALRQAMQQLAYRFVIAESIEDAMKQGDRHPKYRYSFDMLGEAAQTETDASRYYDAYAAAIDALGNYRHTDDVYANPSISIKLSALCPRFEPMQHNRAVRELTEKLLALATRARSLGIPITIDAEESERQEMSLDIFAAVFSNHDLKGWNGFGLAVQVYQKRAVSIIHWLAALAKQQQKKMPLRLVKGAYWDTEIKRTQENGLVNYPVFTHKTATDVCYLACAQIILDDPKAFYPQFATHNTHTVAAIYELGKTHPEYEFQRLHGMGEQFYSEIIDDQNLHIPCRIYAPVGSYQELLPYLVRRLLENGANTSFINLVEDPDISIEEVILDPVESIRKNIHAYKTRIVLPENLYGERRINSQGTNLNDLEVLKQLQSDLDKLNDRQWQAYPLINGEPGTGEETSIVNPFDNRLTVGSVVNADPDAIEKTIDCASDSFPEWRKYPVETRAALLRKAADLLEKDHLELVSLCIREGGRTIKDALAEVREAVDFCRYYADSACKDFGQPIAMPGPTGEENLLCHYGRGVFVCISPWNFPIAIFIGQITAALAAGNTVIAKPAGLTALTAMRCIRLLHQAGIPETVLQFLPTYGQTLGQYLLSDPRIAGVAFTGSTETAQNINRRLAQDHPLIIPLIAETGGQNVMIADSSALTEQVVQDAVHSAFNSAGQRCSALRVLFLQQEVADKIIEMLIGAIQELSIGNPGYYTTDIGPVINHGAVDQLSEHVKRMRQRARVLYQLPLDEDFHNGSFFTPCLIELNALSQLEQENFGPVLHVIRYNSSELDQVIEAVNATGYGLTLGIHSRINTTIRTIQQGVKVGNIYVNRNMIGAVVGVQPFGGMGLSGTGPKAGGPYYLHRFAIEQTVTTNTAAIGGNVGLMAQDLR